MIDAILGVIGTILYPLFSIIFVLIDLVQDIFRAFAGVGTIWYNTGGGTGANANLDKITSGETDNPFADNDGGIVYYLLRSDLVMNLVWSIATLALILLIVFTVIAFIKNIYAPKSKSWQEIIGLSVKGLFNFIFIPVVCLIGVILGNILLNAIDGATSTGGATVMSRKLFLSAAYDANVVRNQGSITYDKANEIIKMRNSYYNNKINEIKIPEGKNGTDIIEGADTEYYANLIDEAFASGGISIYEWFSVGPYYNMWAINYLTLAVGGVFMLYVLGSISFGMIKRMFILIMLFIISPAACAMYPLDEGNACKQITGDFKKNTISAYGAVAGMNIFFSIAPLVNNINLAGATFFQSIIHIILLTCGLFMVKEFIGKISGYFGAENAYESGAGMMSRVKKEVGGRAAKGIKSTVSTFSKGIGAWKQGGFGAANKAFWGDVGRGMVTGLNNMGKTMTGVDVKEDIVKNIGTSYKQGKIDAKAAKDKKNDGEFKEKKAAAEINKIKTAADTDLAADISLIPDNYHQIVTENAIKKPNATAASVRADVLALTGDAGAADDAVDIFIKYSKANQADKMLGKIDNDETKTATIDLVKNKQFDANVGANLGLKMDGNKIKAKNEAIEHVLNIVGTLDNFSEQLSSASTLTAQKGVAKRLQNYLNSVDTKGNKEIQNLINEYSGLVVEVESATSTPVSDTRRGNIDNMVASSAEIGKAIADVSSKSDEVKKKIKDNKKPEEKK